MFFVSTFIYATDEALPKTMIESEKASLEAQSQALRAELKTWETSWANSHDGKKPGRDDIKRNADIGELS